MQITDKCKCCGCTACASACPHDCIRMTRDEEGFTFPRTDLSRCTHCGLCEKVCPMIHSESNFSILEVAGARHREDSVRKGSSSGGVFSVIAEYFIEKGGIVCGCALDEKMQAVHIFASTKQDLIALCSSKYVQSDLGEVFRKIRSLLKEGKMLLFSGTPCQVAGLRRFLRRSYENLFCVDLFCHGVPSPKLYEEYLERMSFRYGSKISSVNFRSKKKGWKRLFIEMNFSGGTHYHKYSGYDEYMALFLSNKSIRSSCFHCPFTTTYRQGDISLGDFWGIGKINYELDDDKGVSALLVNSLHGRELWHSVRERLFSFPVLLDQVISGNKVLCENIKGEDSRNRFYFDYVASGFEFAVNRHIPKIPPWKQHYETVGRFFWIF